MSCSFAPGGQQMFPAELPASGGGGRSGLLVLLLVGSG